MTQSIMSVAALVGSFDDIVRSTTVLAEGIEGEFIKFVSQQEECRKKWLVAENEAVRLKQEIARITAENEALEVKLKHARSQVEVEIKKRMKAEATQDHLERQVALIRELLNDKDTMSRLNDNERQTLMQLSQCHHEDFASPRKRRFSNQDESSGSILSPSDISYDNTEEDLDVSHPRKTLRKAPAPAAQELDVTPPKRPRTDEGDGQVVVKHVVPDSPVHVPVYPSPQIHVQPSAPELNYRDPYRQAIRELEEITSPRKVTPQLQRIASQNGKRPATKEKKHVLCSKTVIKPESCQPCNKRIKFGKLALKCKDCRAVCHPDCKDHLPLPCVPSVDTPGSGRKRPDENIEFYAPTTGPMVPEIVIKCIDEVERRGLSEVGIYRVPGAERSVKELKEKFTQGKLPDLRKVDDIHVVCGLLKDFLRNLAEPLVTYDLWSNFVDAANKTDEDDSASATYQAVSELPQANRDTLAYLILHLQKVSHCIECKMDASNLSKVFGPTIVQNSSANLEPMQMLQEAKWQPKVMERLLSMPVDYWNQFINTDDENIRSPPYNPTSHRADGTPLTPECRPVPESMLGPLTASNAKSVKKKGSFLSRTPLTPRFGSKSKNPNKRPTHFFASPMLK